MDPSTQTHTTEPLLTKSPAKPPLPPPTPRSSSIMALQLRQSLSATVSTATAAVISPFVPKFCIAFTLFSTFFVLPILWVRQPSVSDANPDKAIIGMQTLLMLVWVILLGGLQQFIILFKSSTLNINTKWVATRFFVGATVLSLIESGIATIITNLADPIWGVSSDVASITSSTNYLDNICLHSVVIFLPMFITWSLLLKRYDFHPLWVYVLFGMTGMFGETLASGPNALINAGLWINVYGLMVYLPALRTKSAADAAAREKYRSENVDDKDDDDKDDEELGRSSEDQDDDKPGRRNPHLCAFIAAIFLPMLAATPVAVGVVALQNINNNSTNSTHGGVDCTEEYKIENNQCGENCLSPTIAPWAEKFGGVTPGNCADFGYTVPAGTQEVNMGPFGTSTVYLYDKP